MVTASTSKETVRFHPQQLADAGSGFALQAAGFENVTVFGGGGGDVAHFYDTAGDDTFAFWSNREAAEAPTSTSMPATSRKSIAYASAGMTGPRSTARLATTRYTAGPTVPRCRAAVSCGRPRLRSDNAIAGAGIDQAVFYDSAGDDSYVALVGPGHDVWQRLLPRGPRL